jgi:hypothetical protein
MSKPAFYQKDFHIIFEALKDHQENGYNKNTNAYDSEVWSLLSRFDSSYVGGLESVFQYMNSPKVNKKKHLLAFEELLNFSDEDSLIFSSLILEYMYDTNEPFSLPDIVIEIKQPRNPMDDLRWGRVFLEKIYYDVFSKYKMCNINLLKYLSQDGKRIKLPAIPGIEITEDEVSTKNPTENEIRKENVKKHLEKNNHYKITEAINPEKPVTMALFGSRVTDEAATYVLDVLKDYTNESNSIFNKDFPNSEYSNLTKRGYYFNNDLQKLIKELKDILEISNKELHKILDLPKIFESPESEDSQQVTLEIKKVKEMLSDFIELLSSKGKDGGFKIDKIEN